MADFCIIGIGNPERGDDGAGFVVIDRLKRCSWLPDWVHLDYIGMDPLNMIADLPKYKKVLIIDAVNMGLSPGEIKMFSLDQVEMTLTEEQLNLHGFGLAEALQMVKHLNLDTQIKIIGVQPKDWTYTPKLSDPVSQSIDKMLELIREEVISHG